MARPLVIGLTGGLAAGKTSVAQMLKRLGAQVVDSDHLAHQALKKGTPAYRQILRVFGKEKICAAGGRIDRPKLGRLVFREPAKRKRLEKIVHPFVFRELKRAVKTSRKQVVVLEVPLLFETGFDQNVDFAVVVSAPRGVQIRRACAKFKWSPAEAGKRIGAQWPLRKKEAQADFIIRNGRSWAAAAAQVKQFWKKVNQSPS